MNPQTQPKTGFDYSNLTGRKSGPFVRLGAALLPGVRKVQNQIVPYAEVWQAYNARAITGDKPLWVALGDSMTQGIGATRPERGWVGQLQSRLSDSGTDYRVINLSASGARIRDVLDTQLPAIEALGLLPDLITVMIGSNDLVRKKFRVNALSDFDELLAVLPEGSVVANLLGERGEPVIMDQKLQRAAQERNLKLADIRRDGPRSWRGRTAEDHFHPNEAGYQVISDVFAKAIGIT